MTMAITKVSLKLLVDTNGHRVLFAEAGKDFVDFLFHLLHLPLGTVIRLLTKQSMVGTLGNLYDSIENLSGTYLLPNFQNKETLLIPKAPSITASAQVPLLLPATAVPASVAVVVARKFYVCSCNGSLNPRSKTLQYHHYVADDARALCPQCKLCMTKEVPYVAAPEPEEVKVAAAGEGGFVKGVVTYMVRDDLVVMPISHISTINMLNKFNVKDVGGLEERVVDLGMDEALKLLKASLQSKKVLTSVFLGNMGA